MTSAALSMGSAFLAFSIPSSLLFLLTYAKAQLIIVVTTSAFAYLLAALSTSLLWLPISHTSVSSNAILIILPGVIVQCVFRIGFVLLYQKVEDVVKKSVGRHERHMAANRRRNDNSNTPPESETAKLNLELNDASCGLAAGTGFGGMHSLLLYGTLLSSEMGNGGTLYQFSCPAMPSLVLGAIVAFFFTILDVVWMLLTFYAVRRRKVPHFNTSVPFSSSNGGFCKRLELSNDVKGAKIALGVVLLSHFTASFVTAFHNVKNGCVVSLPVLASIVLLTVLFFVLCVKKNYLPTNGIYERTNMTSQQQQQWNDEQRVGTLDGEVGATLAPAASDAQGGGSGSDGQIQSYHED